MSVVQSICWVEYKHKHSGFPVLRSPVLALFGLLTTRSGTVGKSLGIATPRLRKSS